MKYKIVKDNQPAGKYKEVGPRGGIVNNPRLLTVIQVIDSH